MRISLKIMAVMLLTGLACAAAMFVMQAAGVGWPVVWIVVVILSLLGAAGLFFITVRPVIQLNQDMEMIHAGNLDYQIRGLPKDEFGHLARSLEKIAGEIAEAKTAIDALNVKCAEYQETGRTLHESEEYFRRLFEYSNDAVFIYDFDGQLMDVNKKATEMLGFSRQEFLDLHFFELQVEEELTRSKEAFKTHSHTGAIRFESLFRTKDGISINVEISSSIVDLKKGIMQSIVSNITERKAIEKNLRESEEKFRTFMETANDMMYITNASGEFTYVNLAMINAMGFTRSELIGMPFHDILDTESLEEAKKRRQLLMDMGEDVHELVWETKNRKKITGEMKAVAIFDSEGQFEGIRGVFRDITERKKIEASQRLTQLGKLAADMAHEVNNQLMVIATRARIALMRKPADKALNKDLSIISDQCERIKDMVKRLLMFSKPSKRDYQPVDIHHAIDFVVDLVEQQFTKHKVNIIKEYHAEQSTVTVDEKQMHEVFMNLMRNAFEAMDGDGTITIATSQQNGEIHIDFTDTGGGISEMDMQKIFDPFFTTKETGTGLGLSVCYGIVQAHNGDLRYSSIRGEGTTASVMLPLASE